MVTCKWQKSSTGLFHDQMNPLDTANVEKQKTIPNCDRQTVIIYHTMYLTSIEGQFTEGVIKRQIKYLNF